MALFPSPKRYPLHLHAPPQQARQYQQPVSKTNLADLQLLCKNTAVHPLPVKMTFIAISQSDREQPMAVYACPFKGCTCRQGWVEDFRTGRPLRLWAGHHNGR